MILTERIYESLARWGGHPAFIELAADREPLYVSARDFKARIDRIKEFLIKSGIRKNHIAAIFLKNSVDFAAIFLALIDIGAKPIPVNLAFRRMELDEIFSNADPHAIIMESSHIPVVKPYADGRIILERIDGSLREHDSRKRAASGEPADIGEEIASINYTYRGYGYPLGAMVPHSQYLHGARALAEGLKPEAGMNMLIILPYSYIFPLVVCLCVPLLYRLTSTISNTVNPLKLFSFINNYKINIITAVPELYELIYNLKDQSTEDLSALTDFMSGGSYLKEDLFKKVIESFRHVVFGQGYGLTEFTPVCRHIRYLARTHTIGPLCNGIEGRILSPEADGSGEIAIRTSNMTKAYYRRPRETAEAFEQEWFKTGDIGRMEDGHLIFLKEKKRTRKIKGNMVDLEETRRALMTYPNIREAAVESGNNILTAQIRLDSSKNFDEEAVEIKKFLDHLIAPYKIPKTIARI